MDARTRIELFGDMRVVTEEQTHTRFRTRKAAYLLAYLALNSQQAHPREHLVELFWGDKEEAVGRDGLSTALAQLRRQLERTGAGVPSLFLADKQQVRLNAASVVTDVAEFDNLLAQSRQCEDTEAKAALLQQAVSLYRGELLLGCYEDWATREQTRCCLQYQESLLLLAQLWEEAGRIADALTMAQKVSVVDPFAEEAYRAQMRLLVRLRKPSLALQVYADMEALFQRELGTRPSLLMRQMAEMIRQDPRAMLMMRAETAASAQVTAPSGTRPSVTAAKASSHVCASGTPSTAAIAPLLPLQLTRFFGREQEQEQLCELLQTPGIRLVSILGPGGAGKTRLSVEVAAQVAPAFNNRLWFVSLADIPDASLIVSQLVHTLRLPPDGQAEPLERIVTCLTGPPCLLVLDNMEHLLREPVEMGKNDNPGMSGASALMRLLLQRLPNLVCLVTSRHALRLGGEHIFPLPPFALPSETASQALETLRANDSIALYVDRARAARPDFALTDQNVASVAALCRRLEGMPLALEMAAAWVKTISPAKMLERLEQQLDMLVSRQRDLPPRHQSLRATIEWSYDLLTPELRQTFARLSVFWGGWTLEAAEAVCGKRALYNLIALQEHSLVIVADQEDGPRYRTLEPLREFAQEKLRETGMAEEAQRAHAAYFDSLVREATQHYGDAELKIWMDQLDAERDNLRATFAWYRKHDGKQEMILSTCLPLYWHMRGHAAEGCRLMLEALAHPDAAAPTRERARALEGVAHLLLFQGELDRAQTCAEESAQIWSVLEDSHSSKMILNLLAMIACDKGDPERACELWREMLPLLRADGLKLEEAAILHNLGETLLDLGDAEQACPLLETSLAMLREIQNPERISHALNTLGKALLRLNDNKAACAICEALQLRVAINNQTGLVETLETVVALMSAQGEAMSAIQLAGAAQMLRQQASSPRPANEEAFFTESLSRARAGLDAETYAKAWKQGEAMTCEQAVELGLEYAHSQARI